MASTAEVAQTIDSPRDPYKRRKATRSNYELYSWIFMRASGVVLIVLIFGHLFVNLMVGEGVHAIDFGFVGEADSNAPAPGILSEGCGRASGDLPWMPFTHPTRIAPSGRTSAF